MQFYSMYAVFPLGFFPAVVAGLFPMDHTPSPPKNHVHSESEHVSEAPLKISLCGRALRSVAHGQSKHSANFPLTLTGKPNPAQITLWHNISLVGLIVVFFPPFIMKFVTVMFQGDVKLALFQINFIHLNVLIKIIHLKTCLVFEATWQTFL